MVCIFFSVSLIWYAPRSVFMIWDFVAQYEYIFFLSKEHRKRQTEVKGKMFKTAHSVRFLLKIALQTNQAKFIENKKYYVPRKKIQTQTIKWSCCYCRAHTHTGWIKNHLHCLVMELYEWRQRYERADHIVRINVAFHHII